MDFCERLDISTKRRVRRRMPGENAADAGLSWQDEIKKEQLEILDRLHEEIARRTQEEISTQSLGFLQQSIFS